MLSRAYDVVLNGTELGGGSVRIHTQAMQEAVFRTLGIGEEEARAKQSLADQYAEEIAAGLAWSKPLLEQYSVPEQMPNALMG